VATVNDAPAKVASAIKGGDYAPMYRLFDLYRTRVQERSAYARALLKQDIFDFNGNDRYDYDRKDVPDRKSVV
jgi:carboxyl-terminal processing protease